MEEAPKTGPYPKALRGDISVKLMVEEPAETARQLRKHFCRHVGGESKRETKERSTAMTTLQAKGDWNIAKGKLKQKWATLTDDDLQCAEGKHDEMLGRIQKRTGETLEAVEKAVKEASSCCCK